jgi:hypothetical protein
MRMVFCTSLTSFSTDLSSATNAAFAWHGCSSLTSFSAELPSVTKRAQAWKNCSSLTDFSADVFANWNPSSIASGVFNNTWEGCTSLTAQSVENILVSIDASGHYATTNKLLVELLWLTQASTSTYNGAPVTQCRDDCCNNISQV